MENDTADTRLQRLTAAKLAAESAHLTPSECNAMLDAWRAEFPEMTATVDKWKRRFAEKGSALDRASRLWGCAWLVKGKKRR